MVTTLTRCLPSLALRARAVPARLAGRQPERFFRAPCIVRAQTENAGGEKPAGEDQGLVQRRQQPGSALVSPFDIGGGFPSFGRMGQMFRDLEEEMNQLTRAFGMPSVTTFDLPSTAAAVPAGARALVVDIHDMGDHIEVAADVPGMSKEDIKVTVSPDKVLQISGERKYEKEEGKQGEGMWRVERSYGSFVRRFRLPDNVDPEGIKAQVKDGVLKLTVPKTEEAKPKQIEVQLQD